jgi:hypothetical protein
MTQQRQKSPGEKVVVELLKGLVRHLGAPSPAQRAAPRPQPQAPLSGCGGCKGRK